MTGLELLHAAHRMRVVDVPGCGFLVDDQPADTHTHKRLVGLLEDGLLERGSDQPDEPSLLVPTRAGLARIGVTE